MSESIQFTKIAHDVNGNPRYVCHYLNLLTEREKNIPVWTESGRRVSPTKYELAVRRANKIGGRKYHTRAYGGGIVFQSYSIRETERDIRRQVARDEAAQAYQEYSEAFDRRDPRTPDLMSKAAELKRIADAL